MERFSWLLYPLVVVVAAAAAKTGPREFCFFNMLLINSRLWPLTRLPIDTLLGQNDHSNFKLNLNCEKLKNWIPIERP